MVGVALALNAEAPATPLVAYFAASTALWGALAGCVTKVAHHSSIAERARVSPGLRGCVVGTAGDAQYARLGGAP